MTEKDIENYLENEFNKLVDAYIKKYPKHDNQYDIFIFIDGIADKFKMDNSFAQKFEIPQTKFNKLIEESRDFAKVEYHLNKGGMFF